MLSRRVLLHERRCRFTIIVVGVSNRFRSFQTDSPFIVITLYGLPGHDCPASTSVKLRQYDKRTFDVIFVYSARPGRRSTSLPVLGHSYIHTPSFSAACASHTRSRLFLSDYHVANVKRISPRRFVRGNRRTGNGSSVVALSVNIRRYPFAAGYTTSVLPRPFGARSTDETNEPP